MTEYQVGKYYRVSCLLLTRNTSLAPGIWQRVQGGRWVPIISPLHEDQQFFNFSERHYHPDVRFMSQSLLQWYVPRWAAQRDGLPLEQEAMRFPMAVEGNFVRIASREPVLLRRKCQREMPDFPSYVDGWLNTGHRRLEAAYRGCRLRPDHPVCPHKGFPLEGLPEKDGVVICPGHGLAFDMNTGELVPRQVPGVTRLEVTDA